MGSIQASTSPPNSNYSSPKYGFRHRRLFSSSITFTNITNTTRPMGRLHYTILYSTTISHQVVLCLYQDIRSSVTCTMGSV